MKKLIEEIIKNKAVELRDVEGGEEPFLYASGNWGPGYISIKGLVGRKDIFKPLIANLAFKIICQAQIDFVAGNVTGGMIPGWELSNYLEKPFEINEIREIILEALKEKKGFNGKVSDFQLSDIIQLNCLGRHTLALKVVNEDEVGHIYFNDGNIVHAETNTMEGENAFYYILSWLGGEFSLLQNQKTKQETINKGWQSLLLEALRRADEKSGAAYKNKEQEKQKRIQKIHLHLKIR